MDNYPATFAFIQIHHGDAYATSWGNTRANFYSLAYYPESWFDGTIHRVGAQTYATYENDYLTRRALTTDVTIEVGGVEISSPIYEITAEVCIESGGTGKTMRIYMVQVLDYWPIPPSYSRNGFKQAADAHGSEPVITLAPGECQQIVRTFDLTDSMGSQADIKIIVWAQENNAGGPAEVYQAAIMTWPFTPFGPVNDDCEDATEAGNAAYSYSTELGTKDGDASCDSLTSLSPDVWYTYRAPADGTLEVDTCGSSFDTVISIHADCPGTEGNESACNNDSDECGVGSLQSYLSLPVTEGETYLFRLSGYDDEDKGDYDVTFDGPVDVTPPTPDPLQFSTAPWAYSDDEIRMTAELATDNGSPDIEYEFDFVSGGSGGDDSGWQSSRDYADTGLSPNTAYTYRVRAQDGAQNPTGYGDPATAYTLAEKPGQPTRSNITAIRMDLTLDPAGNPAPTEFAISCVVGSPGWSGKYVDASGNPTGTAEWQTADQWGTITVWGLTGQTNYCWCAKARNADGIETAFGSWGCSQTLLLGDIDANGQLNDVDITLFVDVLLGGDVPQAYIDRSDLNGDGMADGRDTQRLVEAFLTP